MRGLTWSIKLCAYFTSYYMRSVTNENLIWCSCCFRNCTKIVSVGYFVISKMLQPLFNMLRHVHVCVLTARDQPNSRSSMKNAQLREFLSSPWFFVNCSAFVFICDGFLDLSLRFYTNLSFAACQFLFRIFVVNRQLTSDDSLLCIRAKKHFISNDEYIEPWNKGQLGPWNVREFQTLHGFFMSLGIFSKTRHEIVHFPVN